MREAHIRAACVAAGTYFFMWPRVRLVTYVNFFAQPKLLYLSRRLMSTTVVLSNLSHVTTRLIPIRRL